MENFELPTLDLDVPIPDPKISFGEMDDYVQLQILKINGYATDAQGLIAVLESTPEAPFVILEAAAHSLGVQRRPDAEFVLKKLTKHRNELVALECQYALYRIDPNRYPIAQIKYHFDYQLDAYFSPARAAGYLARYGDYSGMQVIGKLLESELSLYRMQATKQLYYFLGSDDTSVARFEDVTVYAFYSRALRDAQMSIRWEALRQLQEAPKSAHRNEVLKDYLQWEADPAARSFAQQMLQ